MFEFDVAVCFGKRSAPHAFFTVIELLTCFQIFFYKCVHAFVNKLDSGRGQVLII